METLRMEGHVTSLLAEMYTLQQNTIMCDTSLVASDGTVEVHSLVLVSVSPNLLATLKQRPGRKGRSKKDWVFFLMSYTCSVVQKLVHFIYTGEIQVTEGEICELEKIFKELQLSRAAELCSQFIKQSKEPSHNAPPQPDTILDQQHLEAATSQQVQDGASQNEASIPEEDSQQAELDRLLTDLANGGSAKACANDDESILYDAQQTYTLLKVGSSGSAPIPTPVEEKEGKVYNRPGQDHAVMTVPVKICSEEGSDMENDEGENLTALSPSQLTGAQTQEDKSLGNEPTSVDMVSRLNNNGNSVVGIMDSRSEPMVPKPVKAAGPALDSNKVPWKRPPGDHRCTCCNASFKVKKQMLSHQRECLKLWRKNRCNRCNGIFSSDLELQKHMESCVKAKKERGPKSIGCTLCDYKCRTQKMKLSHMHNKHGVPYDTNNGRFPVLVCDYPKCKFQTLFMFWMTAHKRKHDDKLAFNCDTCAKGFKTAVGLRNHQKGFHEGKMLSCKVCGKKYVSSSTLEAHIQRIHCKKKEFQCEHCPYQAFDLLSLESHMFSRHNIPYPENRTSYSCPHCSYTTRRKNQYNAHVRRHMGDNPYQCDTCGKCFPGRSDLTAHNKWHVDMADRKHKCTFEGCSYAAILPNRLQEHIRQQHTHKHIKPFKCEMCGYQSNIRGNLILHLRRTHKITIPTNRYRVHPVEGSESFIPSNNDKMQSIGLIPEDVEPNTREPAPQSEVIGGQNDTEGQGQPDPQSKMCLNLSERVGVHTEQFMPLSNPDVLSPPHQMQPLQHEQKLQEQPHQLPPQQQMTPSLPQEQMPKKCTEPQHKLQPSNPPYQIPLDEPINFKASAHSEEAKKYRSVTTPADIQANLVPSHFQGHMQGQRQIQSHPGHMIDGYKQYHFQLQGPIKDSMAQFPSHIPQLPADMNRPAYPSGMFHPVAMPTFWSPQAPTTMPPDGGNSFSHHTINDMTQM